MGLFFVSTSKSTKKIDTWDCLTQYLGQTITRITRTIQNDPRYRFSIPGIVLTATSKNSKAIPGIQQSQ
ncbi:MAG: hypothetical protein P1V97_37160 [Planctomycetota bacterium]|nr:hypothetical protein [Planctomycetota bacterium]